MLQTINAVLKCLNGERFKRHKLIKSILRDMPETLQPHARFSRASRDRLEGRPAISRELLKNRAYSLHVKIMEKWNCEAFHIFLVIS